MNALAGESHMQHRNNTEITWPFTMTPFSRRSFNSVTKGPKNHSDCLASCYQTKSQLQMVVRVASLKWE